MARADRREAIYLSEGDLVALLMALEEMGEWTGIAGWAYCLMGNRSYC